MKNILVTFLICLPLYSCYDYESDYEDVDRSLLPSVIITPIKGVLANGRDSLNIRVIFPNNVEGDLAKVNFTTTEGVFYENNKTEYSSTDLRAKSDIRNNSVELYISANLNPSTKVGSYIINVEVPGVYKRPIKISFLPSYPNSISTSKNKFAVSRTYKDEIQLFAKLSALEGLPNQGTSVEFVVADSLSSNSSRLFRSLTTTDSSGQASVFFTPGNFGNYNGPVSYKVIAKKESGEVITAIGNFEVIEPEE